MMRPFIPQTPAKNNHQSNEANERQQDRHQGQSGNNNVHWGGVRDRKLVKNKSILKGSVQIISSKITSSLRTGKRPTRWREEHSIGETQGNDHSENGSGDDELWGLEPCPPEGLEELDGRSIIKSSTIVSSIEPMPVHWFEIEPNRINPHIDMYILYAYIVYMYTWRVYLLPTKNWYGRPYCSLQEPLRWGHQWEQPICCILPGGVRNGSA